MFDTPQQVRERMRQIKKAREELAKENGNLVLGSKAFMAVVRASAGSPSKYLWSDNPLCACCGISDIDEYESYYCPVEDLTEEEIEEIEEIEETKPKPPKDL